MEALCSGGGTQYGGGSSIFQWLVKTSKHIYTLSYGVSPTNPEDSPKYWHGPRMLINTSDQYGGEG